MKKVLLWSNCIALIYFVCTFFDYFVLMQCHTFLCNAVFGCICMRRNVFVSYFLVLRFLIILKTLIIFVKDSDTCYMWSLHLRFFIRYYSLKY